MILIFLSSEQIRDLAEGKSEIHLSGMPNSGT
jgi:hypothetical protein